MHSNVSLKYYIAYMQKNVYNWLEIYITQTPKKYYFDKRAMNWSSFLTIVHFSDFHYNPYYAPGSSSDCMEEICCRNSSVVCILNFYRFLFEWFFKLLIEFWINDLMIAQTKFYTTHRLLGRLSRLRYTWILNRKYMLSRGN